MEKLIKDMNRMEEGRSPDFDPFLDEQLWDKIDKDVSKQAKKVVWFLDANHDRRSVQFHTYADENTVTNGILYLIMRP